MKHHSDRQIVPTDISGVSTGDWREKKLETVFNLSLEGPLLNLHFIATLLDIINVLHMKIILLYSKVHYLASTQTKVFRAYKQSPPTLIMQ